MTFGKRRELDRAHFGDMMNFIFAKHFGDEKDTEKMHSEFEKKFKQLKLASRAILKNHNLPENSLKGT